MITIWLVETEIASGLEEEHFIAHRRGKSWPSMVANLLGAAWSISEVISRFLDSRSVNFDCSSKVNYFRPMRVRWCMRDVQGNSFCIPIIRSKFFPKRKIFGVIA